MRQCGLFHKWGQHSSQVKWFYIPKASKDRTSQLLEPSTTEVQHQGSKAEPSWVVEVLWHRFVCFKWEQLLFYIGTGGKLSVKVMSPPSCQWIAINTFPGGGGEIKPKLWGSRRAQLCKICSINLQKEPNAFWRERNWDPLLALRDSSLGMTQAKTPVRTEQQAFMLLNNEQFRLPMWVIRCTVSAFPH